MQQAEEAVGARKDSAQKLKQKVHLHENNTHTCRFLFRVFFVLLFVADFCAELIPHRARRRVWTLILCAIASDVHGGRVFGIRKGIFNIQPAN